MAANALPVELIELIFAYVSPVDDKKNLRLSCRAFADAGFSCLFDTNFTHLSWRDDVTRLENWSRHNRLRRHLRSWTLNLARLNEHSGRHASFFQYWFMDPEDREAVVLRQGWAEFYEAEAKRKSIAPLCTEEEENAERLVDAAGRLEALEEVKILFNECPYDGVVLRRAFADPSVRWFEAREVGTKFEMLTRVLRNCGRLKRLQVDRLPMKATPSVDTERIWSGFAKSVGTGLEEVRLGLDFSNPFEEEMTGETTEVPRSWTELVEVVLASCRSVQVLEVKQHFYHPLGDRTRKTGRLNQVLLRDTTWRLTDLKLEGFATTQEELFGFVRSQLATLKRVRLGGRGIANVRDRSRGGIWLEMGTWFGFFTGLRSRLRAEEGGGVLKKIHLEGDFRQVDEVEAEVDGEGRRLVEKYDFYPTTDDCWRPLETPEWMRGSLAATCLDGSAFARYVLEDEDVGYPGFAW
ncbi:uncharacterized protein ColSpa_08711 [Colletotrichum spaethianum]|uniref:F-box domain-containing protein n=1 Tax=Colletotrichum spaethianum TaxID=700344 RepID=A0AA37PA80_9PEZI|nr:uncharacterized protein ColSpa_08711 [Colletotrichum spaethianum]GKT48530.1 hypothetical protein ColSpa_08711 [Colletotrichum spaethianum]